MPPDLRVGVRLVGSSLRRRGTPWLAVCNQWRVGPAGDVLWLDWPVVDVLLRLLGMGADADLIGALRRMEGEARRALLDAHHVGAGGTDSGAEGA